MDDDVAKGCGTGLLLAAGLATYWGWPASGFAIGFGVFSLVLASGEDLVAAQGLAMRTLKGVIGTARKAAFWVAVGCAAVWLIQIVLNLIAAPDAERIGEAELAFAGKLARLKEYAHPFNVALLMAGALALALAVQALWPINAAARLKKWAGKTAAAMAAVASFGFVGVGAADTRYQAAEEPLRARIAEDLDALVEARKQGAGFRLLNATIVQEIERSKPEDNDWRTYFEYPTERCRADELAFHKAYRDAQLTTIGSAPTYCDAGKIWSVLVDGRIKLPSRESDPASNEAWLPDFADRLGRPAATSNSVDFGGEDGLSVKPMPLQALLALRKKVREALAEAQTARSGLREAATGAATTMMKNMLPQQVADIVDHWAGTLIEDIGKMGSGQIAKQLRLTRLAGNGAVAALIGPPLAEARINAPGPRSVALTYVKRGYASYVSGGRSKIAPSPESIRELAKETAIDIREARAGRSAGSSSVCCGPKAGEDRYTETLPERPPTRPIRAR